MTRGFTRAGTPSLLLSSLCFFKYSFFSAFDRSDEPLFLGHPFEARFSTVFSKLKESKRLI